MGDIRTMLDPLTDRVNNLIASDEAKLIIMCVFIGIGLLASIACHFLPKNHGRSR